MDINLAKLNEFEKAIVDNRINGIAVCDIDEKENSLMAEVAIFKISAICGFTLTSSEKFADILNEELVLFLKEFGYSDLTWDEIVSAFRLNAKGWYRIPSTGDTFPTVLPYSTFFSINYAGQVLQYYKRIRQAVDYKIKENIIERRNDFSKYE